MAAPWVLRASLRPRSCGITGGTATATAGARRRFLSRFVSRCRGGPLGICLKNSLPSLTGPVGADGATRPLSAVTRGRFPNGVTTESLFRERHPAAAGLAEDSGEVRQPGTAEGPGADLTARHPKASTAELRPPVSDPRAQRGWQGHTAGRACARLSPIYLEQFPLDQ